MAQRAGDDVVGAVLALHRMVGTTLEYAAGATQIGVDVNDVLRGRKGVFQDYAHLLIALARSIGVPARYVSGYLFAARETDSAGPDADSVSVKTHAWVELAIPGAGWWGLDPHQPRGGRRAPRQDRPRPRLRRRAAAARPVPRPVPARARSVGAHAPALARRGDLSARR